MLSLLFVRVFILVGGMLLVTASMAKVNHAFETAKETWITIGASIINLIALLILADVYPLNIILVATFSALVGWEIGPTIEYYGKRFKFSKWAKAKGLVLKKGQLPPKDIQEEFEKEWKNNPYQDEWHNIVFQALMGTAVAVFAAATTVFLTNWDFGVLGLFLFMALIILVIMALLNLIFFRSRLISLIKAYLGVIIFTLYLLFDFNQLEKMAHNDSWSAAINISVNIYLDIINLFLDLLRILSDD